ncbi:uncharacterized protein E0L32_010469 [Thyridium curvatum]|uniref:DNA-directed RNA polymerase III subunit RPC9 n=1 Tax=Thyridium curvatum TaxID=1093900 RepID=A0A507ANI1_9PEZI|nr:uncharacterized protein E0L32_010469 [Thyridium curvatum]TPX07894.1 hypothetical protein E0L32_010469 [Thyridium curvatum]
MKILEAQNAVLTNYEVYQFLLERKNRKDGNRSRRGPPNYETLVKEVLEHLETNPNPLSQRPLTYTPEAIPLLIEKLHPYDLTKGEMIMIINLRPGSIPALNCIVEDMVERLYDHQQEEVLGIISETLGAFPAPEETAEGDEGAADEEAA